MYWLLNNYLNLHSYILSEFFIFIFLNKKGRLYIILDTYVPGKLFSLTNIQRNQIHVHSSLIIYIGVVQSYVNN